MAISETEELELLELEQEKAGGSYSILKDYQKSENKPLSNDEIISMIRDEIKQIPKPKIQEKIIERIIEKQIPKEEKKETRQFAEEKTVDLLKKEIILLKDMILETRQATALAMTAMGGSGVIGIPPPEGNPDGYILTIINRKASWKLNAGGTASTPFSIASFGDGVSSPILIGTGVWKAIGTLNFSASYTNGPATSGVVSSSGYNNLNLTNSFQGPTPNAQDINYPSVGGAILFSLSAAGDNGSGSSSISHLFANNRYWGVSAKSSGFNSGDVTGLATLDISDSRSNSFSISPGSSQYIIYSYPTRLGLATFSSNGFQGGFNDPETISITNANGFTENYYVYSSVNSNLGTTSVVVS